jgi:hypothetical protein
MKYYISSGNRRKKNVFLILLITITLIGFVATAALTSGFFYVNKKIGENLVSIEAIKQNTLNLKTQMDTSEKNLEVNKKKLDILNEQIIRFQPVIIPDSMLKDQAITQ